LQQRAATIKGAV